MQKILSCILFAFIATSLMAQDDVKEKMNEIKADETYFWGEATDENREDASEGAITMMLEVMGNENVIMPRNKAMSAAKFLYMNRGERIRAFAYMKKEDAMTQDKKKGTDAKPKKKEEPAIVQKKQEKTEDVDSVATDMTVTEKKEVPQQAQQTATVQTNSVASSVVMVISGCEQISDAYRCLEEYKREGSISACGKVKSKADMGSDVYLIIFDSEQSVRAILSPESNGARKNMSTGSTDAISNYKGCGAVWFK